MWKIRCKKKPKTITCRNLNTFVFLFAPAPPQLDRWLLLPMPGFPGVFLLFKGRLSFFSPGYCSVFTLKSKAPFVATAVVIWSYILMNLNWMLFGIWNFCLWLFSPLANIIDLWQQHMITYYKQFIFKLSISDITKLCNPHLYHLLVLELLVVQLWEK